MCVRSTLITCGQNNSRLYSSELDNVHHRYVKLVDIISDLIVNVSICDAYIFMSTFFSFLFKKTNLFFSRKHTSKIIFNFVDVIFKVSKTHFVYIL